MDRIQRAHAGGTLYESRITPASGTDAPNTAPRRKPTPDWWRHKLDTNVERDRTTDTALTQAGWTVIRIWEHEDAATAADRVEATVRNR